MNATTNEDKGLNIGGTYNQLPPEDYSLYEKGAETMEYAIFTRDLTKYYGKFLAVDRVNLRVPFNTIYGFLGPNGAGKTTTIRMLCGLTKVSGGDAIVNGHSVRKEPERVKASVGVVQDISNLYPELTCFDNLMFSAGMYGVPKRLRKERVLELLKFFELEDKKDEKFLNLSRGLKRRLTIAAALVHKPKILLLDEPTLGLDVKSRRKMWKLIRALKDEGLTIFLTSHNVYEVSRLSERVAVINRGRIVAEGTPSELKKLVPYDETIELGVSEPKRVMALLKKGEFVDRAYVEGDTLKVVSKDPLAAIEEISRILKEEGIEVNFMNLRSADMEEVFLKIVEGEGVEGAKIGIHSQKGH